MGLYPGSLFCVTVLPVHGLLPHFLLFQDVNSLRLVEVWGCPINSFSLPIRRSACTDVTQNETYPYSHSVSGRTPGFPTQRGALNYPVESGHMTPVGTQMGLGQEYSGFLFLSKFTNQKRPSSSKSKWVRMKRGQECPPKSCSFTARRREDTPTFLIPSRTKYSLLVWSHPFP